MESVTTFAPSSVEPIRVSGATGASATERLITVTAVYQLSEDGRKASLLAGGDGRAKQTITMQLPANRLHLVTVDANGAARLKLRPRYEFDALQQVVRIDALPTYDRPPVPDDLLREAARNHQLERAYSAERTSARTKRRVASSELREVVAQQFLADRAKRALTHPVPTPERCSLVGPEGRLHFDVTSDIGEARLVPPEAHRRFRADLRARADRKRDAYAAQAAIYEEKKRVAAEFVATHGTTEQQARHAAGVLPMSEMVDLMTDQTFRPLERWPIYPLDGAERLQAHLRQFPEYAQAAVSLLDLAITVKDAHVLSQAQWALVQELSHALPGAIATLRAHRLAWKRYQEAPSITVFGVRVKYAYGPFTLCREYDAPAA
jgi:hypothetical protein